MTSAFFRVAFIAVSLALDVFAVSVGVGMRGVSRGTKVRIGAAFAAAEVAMAAAGIGLGALAGRIVGDVAGYVGFAALIGIGIFMIVEGDEAEALDLSHGWGLVIGSLSISLDSLGVGFSLRYVEVPVGVTLATIAVASVASTTVGLAFGKRFGAAIGERAEVVAGAVLVLTGLAFAALKIFRPE